MKQSRESRHVKCVYRSILVPIHLLLLSYIKIIMSVSKLVFDAILSRFPKHYSLAFAYGSSVFPQSNKLVDNAAMVDFIFAVDDPSSWHKSNMEMNYNHYSLVKYAGSEFIKNLQEHFGAKVYFNTLVNVENRLIKYGVISTSNLIEDLLDWQTLYISGRLHKPVKILNQIENSELQNALKTNQQSALHSALLCLPETFTEEELYIKIAELSYCGDFRMYFGEDKQKVQKIVKNQMPHFKKLYAEELQLMPLLYWSQNKSIIEQDNSSATTLHHLFLLPKRVQHNLLVTWNRDGRFRDMEEVLQSVAHDPDCSEMVKKAIQNITLLPSITQSAKGILTAGVLKSIKYSSRKLKKMVKSMT